MLSAHHLRPAHVERLDGAHWSVVPAAEDLRDESAEGGDAVEVAAMFQAGKVLQVSLGKKRRTKYKIPARCMFGMNERGLGGLLFMPSLGYANAQGEKFALYKNRIDEHMFWPTHVALRNY